MNLHSRAVSVHIVFNLDLEKVSWAGSYLSSLQFENVTRDFIPRKDADVNIFLGDHIDWSSNQNNGVNVYFLAATSFNPLLTQDQNAMQIETMNIVNADLVVLPGFSELTFLTQQFPHLRHKFSVLGFPLNFEMFKNRGNKDPRAVCFVSTSSPVKNNEVELDLASELTKKGFNVTHFSSGGKDFCANITQNARVFGKLPLKKFLTQLSTQKYFISVSHYESLCVSGIQAALLGVIPICPSNSGFLDWCPPQNLFTEYTLDSIFGVMDSATVIGGSDLLRYDSQNYFNNLIASINERCC